MSASLCALAMNATVIIKPKTIRVAMSMYANSILDFVVRVLLFSMVLHAARGKPSFKTSAITPLYPHTSVVANFDPSIFATQNLLNVPYKAGRANVTKFKSNEPP